MIRTSRLLLVLILALIALKAGSHVISKVASYEQKELATNASIKTLARSLQFDQDVVDVGILSQPTKLQLKYINKGRSPIHDIQVRSSCTCQLSHPIGTRLEQGESGVLEIEIDPRRKAPGAHSTAIDISYRDLGPVAVRLFIHYAKEIDIVAGVNLRTHMLRIIKRAGLTPWAKPFHNLRASRQTELAAEHPLHVVCAWIGNSQAIAAKHYLQVTDDDFDRAAGALQKAVQYMSAPIGTESGEILENKAFREMVQNHATLYMLKSYARQESNL